AIFQSHPRQIVLLRMIDRLVDNDRRSWRVVGLRVVQNRARLLDASVDGGRGGLLEGKVSGNGGGGVGGAEQGDAGEAQRDHDEQRDEQHDAALMAHPRRWSISDASQKWIHYGFHSALRSRIMGCRHL